MTVAEAVSTGAPNDLLDRLGGDAAFGQVPSEALRAELEPTLYTGRSSAQVREFVSEYLHPLLRRARPLAAEASSAEVRV
jgi:adenylosuccinate lyase